MEAVANTKKIRSIQTFPFQKRPVLQMVVWPYCAERVVKVVTKPYIRLKSLQLLDESVEAYFDLCVCKSLNIVYAEATKVDANLMIAHFVHCIFFFFALDGTLKISRGNFKDIDERHI